jgi:hypothetical protein
MPGNIPPDKEAAFERLANHLDEEYPYPGVATISGMWPAAAPP